MFKYNQKLFTLALFTLTSITGTILHVSSVSARPSTFQNTCNNVHVIRTEREKKTELEAMCPGSRNPNSRNTYLKLEGIINDNGNLKFIGGGHDANFTSSCTNYGMNQDWLFAQCWDTHGTLHNTQIELNNIHNNSGILSY